ncbi:MAG TPA: ATP-binding protein [Rubricoccaceae bacterium]|nr:ATP-binding protein [Rubricoccaceae bacterium]
MITPLRPLLIAPTEPAAERLVHALRCAGYAPAAAHARSVADVQALVLPPEVVVVWNDDVPDAGLVETVRAARAAFSEVPVVVVGEETVEGAAETVSAAALERLGAALARALRPPVPVAPVLPDPPVGAPIAPAASPEVSAVHAMAEHLPIGLYQSTPDGRILYGNPALARALGCASVEELQRFDLRSDLGYPREHFVEQVQRYGEVRNLEVKWVNRHGRTVYSRENARAVRDADGRVRYYEGTMEDITAEGEAREREQQRVRQLAAIVRFAAAVDEAASERCVYRAAVAAAEASLEAGRALLFVDGEAGLTCVAASEVVSREAVARAEQMGMFDPFLRSADPVPIPDVEAAPPEVLAPEARALLLERKVGALAVLPLVHHGRPHGILLVAYDAPRAFDNEEVTLARTLAWHVAGALARHRAEAALRESEARYRVISDLASDYAFAIRIHPGGRNEIAWATDAFTRISGYAPEVLGSLAGFLGLVHTDSRAAAVDMMRRLGEGEDVDIELQIVARDGVHRWVRHRAHVERDEAQGETLILNSGQDITERKAFERELVAAREAAEEVARLKSAFLANMSHEIRTPLTSILGFADVLAAEVSEEQREFVRFIERSGQRLLDTLNSVLELARLEASGVEPALEVLDVGADAMQAVQLLMPLAEQKGLRLVLVPPQEPALALLDKTCFHRIVMNLVGNAIKFTEEGHVTVRLDADADVVRLRVADTGVGIAPEFLPHLFDEFRQETTGHHRSHEGTGLGLSITRRLVDLLGGNVAVESQRPGGTTFTVSFPRYIPAAHASAGGDGMSALPPPPPMIGPSRADDASRYTVTEAFDFLPASYGLEGGSRDLQGESAAFQEASDDLVRSPAASAALSEAAAMESPLPLASEDRPVPRLPDPYPAAVPEAVTLPGAEPETGLRLEDIFPVSGEWAEIPLDPAAAVEEAAAWSSAGSALYEADPAWAEVAAYLDPYEVPTTRSLEGLAVPSSEGPSTSPALPPPALEVEALAHPDPDPSLSLFVPYDEPVEGSPPPVPAGDGLAGEDATDPVMYTPDVLTQPADTAAIPDVSDDRPSILVVEDNDDTRLLLTRILGADYRVTAVGDARSALDALSRLPFSALVLDINLGGKQTGADILRVARALPGCADVFAIALTAYALPGDRERFLEAGFSQYISKPFTRSALLAALGEGLTRRAA